MRTQAKIILAAALCLAFMGTQVATADPDKAPSSVKLTELSVDPVTHLGTYTGKVKSKNKKCRKGRKVTVIHDSDPPFIIGEARTDEFGNWGLEGPVPPSGDRIIVEVKRTIKCKGATATYEVNDVAAPLRVGAE